METVPNRHRGAHRARDRGVRRGVDQGRGSRGQKRKRSGWPRQEGDDQDPQLLEKLDTEVLPGPSKKSKVEGIFESTSCSISSKILMESRKQGNWRDVDRNDNRNYPGPNNHYTPNLQSNNQRRQTNHKARPKRKMGFFQYVEKMANNEDIEEVILKLFDKKSGFLWSKLLDSKEITNDMIILLVKLLWNVCGSSSRNAKIDLLSAALHSRFMEKLIVFITNIINQTAQDKHSNKYFWDNTDDFWQNILQFSKTVVELIPTNCEPIKKLLRNMSIFFPLIKQTHSLLISDEITAQTSSLLDLVEKTVNDLEVKKRCVIQNIPSEKDMEPPDDFRQIPIVPSAQEIVVECTPFLRANITNKAFTSINQYLDIQFRLLREDFVAPLRRGITTFLRNQSKPKKDWKKLDDIKIYNPIRFLSVENVNECNCYKLMFDFSNKKRTFTYENSKRFMFGSLMCFTNDNFKSLLLGKIVDRNVKLLEQGILIVGFQQEIKINFESDYLMVESSVYFEPYYHVLGVLQKMDTTTFPMEKYIIKVETDSNPPKYLLREEPVMYEIENVEFQAINFPSNRFYNLNDSQLSAFRAALTDEFCIIQGPPGTGKTYLGLRIVHSLLENRHAWYNSTPILVICYTNHALDQFLEGILPETDNVLRVGGQSKNENLKNYNLFNKRKNMKPQDVVRQKRREVRDYVEQLKTINCTLSEIDAYESVISFNCFHEVVERYNNTWFARAPSRKIRKWLLEGKSNDLEPIRQRNNQRREDEIGNFVLGDNTQEDEPMDEIDEEEDWQNYEEEFLNDIVGGIVICGDTPLLSVKQFRNKLQTLNNELQKTLTQPESLGQVFHRENIELEIRECEKDLDYLCNQLEFYRDPRNRRRPGHFDLVNPFNMRYNDRWLLYFYWLDQYALRLRQNYEACSVGFRRLFRVYNDMRSIEDTQLMKKHLVVGMTTTGAARLQSSLQALKSPIVIVEEAAEVLEAHIVASLTNNCKHLILIGDHLQLKPGAADYQIETKFKLGISLFERMVSNKIKCHTLNVQHRMRPEISKLVKPHIYSDLEDHESTLQRAPILGIEKSLYFIDHQEPEDLCQDTSKKNIHECTFVIALARYLILNGYKPEQITILAAYLGQFFEMVREKKKSHNRMLLQDVRIAVLDNYQGEESDIILLSLVRSNTENKAGFLRIQNRVCVALSRARDGFYIMGNMSLLLRAKSENEIWDKVKAVLEEQNAIGTHLTLRCQVHQHKFTQVSKAQDFIKLSEGGCDMLCEVKMACGHICKRLCHVQDRGHQLSKCNEKCIRSLCNDSAHICLKRCYEECGPCTYLVSRNLDCGHTVNIECHIDPAKYSCRQPVMTKLPCEHEAQKPCSVDSETFCCPFPCDTRVEPCGHTCDRSCHIRVDPDHLKYACRELCAKEKKGCSQTGEKHICTRLCFQDCEECNEGVKKIRSCGHVHEIACQLDVEDVECKTRCKKELKCGHPCMSKCFEPCSICEVMVEKIIAECKHTVKIKCHEASERRFCKATVCPRLLPCGHKCMRPCKEACTEICKKIVDCNIQAPCGHFVKRIMCHLKDTTDPKTLLKYCTEPCREELKCEHKCSGSCGECMQSRIHKRCKDKCKVPLVCNHECPIPCRQACKPCERPCGIRCQHSKCKKKCGEPCTPCKQKCGRSCRHVQCTKKCGDICDVPPCDKKCPKSLKCRHPCVGFCGDPCPPLCRICHEEELTEVFFGTEDEEDAVFVLLKDCNHVLEHSGLEEWLEQNENHIEFKTCPKCKTNITTTERYSDYVKRAIQDVILAKRQSFGEDNENEALQAQLTAQLTLLKESCGGMLVNRCRKLRDTLDVLSNRLKSSRNQRRQTINKIELNAIRSKIQTLSYMIGCFEDVKEDLGSLDLFILQLEMLLNVLLRSEDHVTNQEIADVEMEIKRLRRIVQFDSIKRSVQFQLVQNNSEIKSLNENLQEVLFLDKRYTDSLDNAIKINLNELNAKLSSAVNITDQERIEIVQAINLKKGHWFKCPNGHPYAIDRCGGAEQIAKCFCGAEIGGSDHHLLRTNYHAPEMDGSSRHAWPGGLY